MLCIIDEEVCFMADNFDEILVSEQESDRKSFWKKSKIKKYSVYLSVCLVLFAGFCTYL